ncbi:hypothetical protein L202_05723 [Cryptococcus amylolentus CBS 6039]|uniref:Uracil permease n=1 Tax=Cryptococcus amylolentus CBS 6039 TaxID=1295533 RepID=A0A1E3HP21_9TREE|nr:hypothetical protein L202_05723 [Cryptococcus amylolentus CBS 6039]ODN77201.1 hypothetical protein L202_05723 [Cryptococcus amylolentus CBS 6039]
MNLKALLRKLEVDQHGEQINVEGQFINRDTIPQPKSKRNYGPWSFVGIWMVTGSFNIGGYTTGSSLISLGLNVWQSMLVVIIGHIINGFTCVGTGWPGGKYHIGYPILQRAAWGTRGADFVIALRIVLTFTWIAIQLWWGSQVVKTFIGAIWPSFYNLTTPLASGTMVVSDFVAFILYAVICAPVVWFRPQKYHLFFAVSSVAMVICVFSMLGWAVGTAGGPGALVHDTSALAGVDPAKGSDLGYAFVFGISSMLGGLSVHLLHQSDYTRLARKPGDQVFSQLVIVPLGTILNSLIGIIVTSCAAQLYPSEGLLWEPFDLFQVVQSDSGNSGRTRCAVAFASLAFICGQLGLTVCGNTFSGGIDLAGLFPRYFTIRRGAYLTLCMGFVMQPWSLLNGASKFLTVISAFSTFLAPMIAILIADFFILRHRRLSLLHLFTNSPKSIYWSFHGFNIRTFGCWLAGVIPFLPGFASNVEKSGLTGAIRLYKLGFIVGFAIGFITYILVNLIWPPPSPDLEDDEDYFGTFDNAQTEYVERQQVGTDEEKEEKEDAGEKGSSASVHVLGA